MKQWKGELMDMIRDTYKIEEYVCLGGFKNLRKKYDWEGYVLEFDQVTYPFGMNYEIEVETADAAILKPKLTQLLDTLNIQYQDSKRSKFANFFSGSIAL
ncbi:CYTH domain protein [compost metagenome]